MTLSRSQVDRIRSGRSRQSCITPQGRFITKIERSPDGCWNWTGALFKGYGALGIGGKNHYAYAHRLSYEWHRGPIPPGFQIDHLCRNPRCVNPDHLEPVTPRENQLRGFSVSGINARKTQCHNGHPFDVANTHVDRAGQRHCRACDAQRHRRVRQAEEAKPLEEQVGAFR